MPEEINAGVIAKTLDYIEKSIGEIKQDLRGKYVTQDQFDPVKKVVYGLVGLILFMVAAAVIGYVVIESGKNTLPR